MALTLRLSKRFPLTYRELDDNFTYLSSSMSTNMGSAIIKNTITSNQNVGGVHPGDIFYAGEFIETIITDMLIADIPATLGALSLTPSPNSILEVGQAITISRAVFTATANSPAGNYPSSASFTASNASTGNFTLYFGNNVLGSSNDLSLGGSRVINRTSPDTVTFRVNATDLVGEIPLRSIKTVEYIYPIYYGMSTEDYSTSGNPSGSLTTLLQGKGTKQVPIGGTLKYVYFAYPTSYGNLTSIKDGNGFEVKTRFTKYTRNVDGGGGSWTNVSYNIYKTPTTSVSPAQTYTFTF